jgi:hypothetical protein
VTVSETLAGHVVDIACLRRYPEAEYADRAKRHTTDCALMGHCVESGYALVDDDAIAHLLDAHATPLVVAALQASSADRGVQLTVERRSEKGEMVTKRVCEAGGKRDAMPEKRTDEFGNTVNPPGPPAGDPGRAASTPSSGADHAEDSSAQAQANADAGNAD